MDKKRLISMVLVIVSLLIGLAVIIGLVYVLKFKKSEEKKPVLQGEVEIGVIKPVIVDVARPKQEVAPQEKVKASAEQVAISFAERYATYSNQVSIEDRVGELKLYTTKQFLDSIAKQTAQLNTNYQVYRGQVGRVTSVSTVVDNDNKKVYLLAVSIVETDEKSNEKRLTKKLKTELVLSGQIWLASSAIWQ